jgi:hypothetical protein
MDKGLPQWRARKFLRDGVECGTVRREKGHHNRHFHSLASQKVQ